MKKGKCKLYILRHGETEGNKEERVMGHSDSHLTEVGIEQAQKISYIWKEIPFSALYSSDLPRALRTAHIVKGKRSLTIIGNEHLRERFFGYFEGVFSAEFMAKTKESSELRASLPEKEQWRYSLNGVVESDHDLVSRFMTELHRIAQKHLGETVLVVTHGGCIRTLLMKLKMAPYGSLPAGALSNCGYIVAHSDGSEFKIEQIKGLNSEKVAKTKT